jgi:hypothetical protein
MLDLLNIQLSHFLRLSIQGRQQGRWWTFTHLPFGKAALLSALTPGVADGSISVDWMFKVAEGAVVWGMVAWRTEQGEEVVLYDGCGSPRRIRHSNRWQHWVNVTLFRCGWKGHQSISWCAEVDGTMELLRWGNCINACAVAIESMLRKGISRRN